MIGIEGNRNALTAPPGQVGTVREVLPPILSLSLSLSLRLTAGLLLWLSAARPVSGAEWFFAPLGKLDEASVTGFKPSDIASGGPLSRSGQVADPDAESGPVCAWSRAGFPHSRFDALNPGRDVYGVYACRFRLPRVFPGRDLVLFLGVIDDADIAYVNGIRIGGTGSYEASGSAWNTDREYRIPADLLKPGENLILVRVYDKWGLGGILGPPVLGVRISEEWGSAPDPVGASRTPHATRWLSGPLTFVRGRSRLPPGSPRIGSAERDPARAQDLPLGQASPHAARGGDVMGLTLSFDLVGELAKALTPDGMAGSILDLGLVYDAAEVRLNGRLVGRAGRLPDRKNAEKGAFLQTAKRLRCILPAELLRDAGNALEVAVYRTGTAPPLPFTPMLVLPATLGWSAPEMRSAAKELEIADILIQSLEPGVAQKRLRELVKRVRAEDGRGCRQCD